MCVRTQDSRLDFLNGAGGPKLRNSLLRLWAFDWSAFHGDALEALLGDFPPPSRGPKNLLPALCAGGMKLSVPIRNEAISPMILAIIPLAFQAYLVEGFLRSPIPRVAASRGCPLGDLGFRNLWPPMTQDTLALNKIPISVSGFLIEYVYQGRAAGQLGAFQ